MGQKKRAATTKDSYDDFQPSAPVSTGTIPRQKRSESGEFNESHGHSEVVNDGSSLPSAPPLDLMDHFHGYESVSFDAICIPPPNSLDPESDKKRVVPDRAELVDIPSITEQEARAALLSSAESHCCWGKSAARDMAVLKITSTSAYHYQLETFTEKRETSWAFVPYIGGDVDGSDQGRAPLPWEISAEPSQMFASEVKIMQVPHTASVKQCHKCQGSGNLPCNDCHGKGWTTCFSCHGDGWRVDSQGDRQRCLLCQSVSHGKGRQDCLKCNARGRATCSPCNGHGRILCYISLTITWKLHSSEYIVKNPSLNEEMIKRVSGQVVYQEESPRVFPLTSFAEQTVSLASAQLILQHQNHFPEQKIISQRQQVRMIPVSEVEYSWKSSARKFYIYGYENRVHVPDYPQTCCWGCTLQ